MQFSLLAQVSEKQRYAVEVTLKLDSAAHIRKTKIVLSKNKNKYRDVE